MFANFYRLDFQCDDLRTSFRSILSLTFLPPACGIFSDFRLC